MHKLVPGIFEVGKKMVDRPYVILFHFQGLLGEKPYLTLSNRLFLWDHGDLCGNGFKIDPILLDWVHPVPGFYCILKLHCLVDDVVCNVCCLKIGVR